MTTIDETHQPATDVHTFMRESFTSTSEKRCAGAAVCHNPIVGYNVYACVEAGVTDAATWACAEHLRSSGVRL